MEGERDEGPEADEADVADVADMVDWPAWGRVVPGAACWVVCVEVGLWSQCGLAGLTERTEGGGWGGVGWVERVDVWGGGESLWVCVVVGVLAWLLCVCVVPLQCVRGTAASSSPYIGASIG